MYKLMESTPTRTRYRVMSSKEVALLANAIVGKRVTKKVSETVANPVAPAAAALGIELPEITPEVTQVEEEVLQLEPAITEPEQSPVEVVVEQEPEVQEAEETAEVAEEPVEDGTPLSVLGLSANNEKNLKHNNLNSVEELSAFLASGATLENLPRIGTKAEAAILEALEKWQIEQKN